MENVDVSGQLGSESHIGCRWVFSGLLRLNIRGCGNEKNIAAQKNFDSVWYSNINSLQSNLNLFNFLPFYSVQFDQKQAFYVAYYASNPSKARSVILRGNVFSLLPISRLIFVNKCLVHLHLRQQVVAWHRQACILMEFDKSALRTHLKLWCVNVIQSSAQLELRKIEENS